MMSLLVLSLGMQAQTKFHDVEANDATGAVKCIKSSMMGRDFTINFTKDGKMSREGMTDAQYDANGYLISVKMSFQGNEVPIKYTWENGRIKTTPTGVVTGIKQPPYPAWFYRQIVDDHGEVLRAGKE